MIKQKIINEIINQTKLSKDEVDKSIDILIKTLNKQKKFDKIQIINEIINQTKLSKENVEYFLRVFFELIISENIEGKVVEIEDLGVFSMNKGKLSIVNQKNDFIKKNDSKPINKNYKKNKLFLFFKVYFKHIIVVWLLILTSFCFVFLGLFLTINYIYW